jgi:hypothetical protein
MTQLKLLEQMNYSPQPRSAYRWIVGGHSYGPATSPLLDTPQAWNLAFLSHDYESRREHPDPNFSTHVRRTTQVRLSGNGIDLTSTESGLMGSLLLLPAPRFVYLIKHHPLLPKLPMFEHYGPQWLEVIDKRSRVCVADSHVDKLPNPKDEEDLYHMVLAIVNKAKSGT